MAAVGDRVLYVPHIDHAFDRGPAGDFAWDFCAVSDKQESPAVLTGEKVLEFVRFRKAGRELSIRPLRPRVVWPAIITALAPDGKASLDIAYNGIPGVTNQYQNVPHDPDGAGHTWHEEQ